MDGPGGRSSYVPDLPEFRDAVKQREREGYRVVGEERRGDERDQRRKAKARARRKS
jgi:hypothetical protein